MEAANDRLELISRLLSASSLRARVLAANIANQNVPGYKRQVVRFEELLASRLENGGDLAGVEPVVETDLITPASPDGNNVNLELETNSMRENWVRYQAYATILEGRLNLMKAAITERV